jgi:hypothetical protein
MSQWIAVVSGYFRILSLLAILHAWREMCLKKRPAIKYLAPLALNKRGLPIAVPYCRAIAVSPIAPEAAKSLKTTKAKLVRNAIINLLEDIEDIRDAKAVLAKRKKPIPLAQLKAEEILSREG